MAITVALTNGNHVILHTDTSKIFLFDNQYEEGSYTNDGYSTVSLAKGTVMGRIATTQKLVPCESDASDGSQFPVGVLADDYDVLSGATATITICVAGQVDEGLLVFTKTGDALSTVVSSRSFRDRLAADTVGIKLRSVTDLTKTDND